MTFVKSDSGANAMLDLDLMHVRGLLGATSTMHVPIDLILSRRRSDKPLQEFIYYITNKQRMRN